MREEVNLCEAVIERAPFVCAFTITQIRPCRSSSNTTPYISILEFGGFFYFLLLLLLYFKSGSPLF